MACLCTYLMLFLYYSACNLFPVFPLFSVFRHDINGSMHLLNSLESAGSNHVDVDRSYSCWCYGPDLQLARLHLGVHLCCQYSYVPTVDSSAQRQHRYVCQCGHVASYSPDVATQIPAVQSVRTAMLLNKSIPNGPHAAKRVAGLLVQGCQRAPSCIITMSFPFPSWDHTCFLQQMSFRQCSSTPSYTMHGSW